jgi:hypothetical protein
LDAAGWHALAAGHMGIHRGQIEQILKKLSISGNPQPQFSVVIKRR